MINSKIQVKLESFNYQLLNSSCNKLKKILDHIITKPIGIISLPTKKRIYCVLRSPHVDKDSREHFEIRIHKKILEICYSSDENHDIIQLLSKADLPAGVFYKLLF